MHVIDDGEAAAQVESLAGARVGEAARRDRCRPDGHGGAARSAEIAEQLHLRKPKVMVHGFDRPNIRLSVEAFHDAAEKDRRLLDR